MAKGSRPGAMHEGGSQLVSKSDMVVSKDRDSGVTKPATSKPSRAKSADVGNALRSVYQQTIAEQVPSEMLDLLGKLD